MSARDKRTSSKGKAASLERIRNNQRRCRARQKEYIQGLEDKIRRYESDAFDSTTNQKLEKLVIENESLKGLLRSLGLHDDFIVAYGNAAQIAQNFSQTTHRIEHSPQARRCSSRALSPNILQPHLVQNSFCNSRAQCTSDPPSSDVADARRDPSGLGTTDSPLSRELPDLVSAPTCASLVAPMEVQAESFSHATMEALLAQAFGDVLTAEVVSDTTSLCSWAFSLLLKNNSKGYSAADLDLKLRIGYRHGATPTEGCRIDNKTLLEVLAEVS